MQQQDIIKGIVISQYCEGKSYSQIEKHVEQFNLSVAKSTISKYCQLFNKNKSFDDLKDMRHLNHYHPYQDYEADRDRIVDSFEQDPSLSLRKAQNDATINPNNLCHKSISNILSQNGLKSFKIPTKIQLSDKHQKERRKYANSIKKSKRMVFKILFSDESKIYAQKIGSRSCWVRDKEDIPDNLIQDKKQYPLSVSVFGVIDFRGPLFLEQYEGSLSADSYINLLEKTIYTLSNDEKQQILFMQDGATCHTAKKTIKSLEENQIKLIKWVARSPDLNPIEHTWALLKDLVWKSESIDGKFNDKEELFDFVKNEFFHNTTIKNQIIKEYENYQKKTDQLTKNKENIKMTLSQIEIGQIIGLKSEGKSASQVKKKLLQEGVEISSRQINRIYSDWINLEERKKIIEVVHLYLMSKQQQKLKKLSPRMRFMTAVDISKRPSLNPNGATQEFHPQNQRLQIKNINQRYDWVMDMNEWSQNELEKIIFTDESNLSPQKQGEIFVRAAKGSQIPNKYFRLKEMYNVGKQIIVWGAISSTGPVALFRIEGTLNGQSYIEILQSQLLTKLSFINDENILQQNNSAIHSSKVVNSKMKVIAILVFEIVLIFAIAISSLQIALQYTKEFMNEYVENIFQNEIEFNSNIQSIISFRLTKEIFKLPVNLNIINSFHEKIILGNVKYNNKYQPSILNIKQTYKSQINPDYYALLAKNQMLINSWYQQNASQINELDFEELQVLYNYTRSIPLVNAIYFQSQQNATGIITLPYIQMQVFSSQTELALTNYVNSSLEIKLDTPNCYKGLFNYTPSCRFFYVNSLNQTSVFMNPPQVTASATPPYISQYVCQRAMYYDQQKQKVENNRVQCILLKLSNIYNYFENIIQSSKQYYVIDPRTLLVYFNSKKQYNYSTITSADNFYKIELQYLEQNDQSQEILKFIQDNYNTWVFSQQNDSYANLLQMFDLSKRVIIMDYKRNGTTYKAIFNPIIQHDQIPKFITKYTQHQGLLLEYAYLQINIISEEDLKTQTNQLLNFFFYLFIGMQVALLGFSIIILVISVIFAIYIQAQINRPIIRMIQTLKKINQLKELVDISEIIKKYEEKAKFIFLSKETYLLYQSFLDLFEMIQYTSESFFIENEGKNLISLSKKVDFFTKFKNYNAAGVTYNNIGNILLNQQHYFQALEHFSMSIMYAKYEISLFLKSNPDSVYQKLLQYYSFTEQINQNPETLQQRKINSYNFFKMATPKSQFMKSSQLIEEKKSISEKMKEQALNFSNQKQQRQFFHSKKQYEQFIKQIEDKLQAQELILNLLYRQQNYLITLIAFQEHKDSQQQKKKQSKGFDFWKETKNLIKEQIKLINIDPELQYLNIFMNCLLSKCYYNQFQYFKAKQKFEEAQNILLYFRNQGQDFKNTPTLKENFFDNSQRNQNRQSYFTDLNQLSPDISNKFGISFKKQQSRQLSFKNFNPDLIEQLNISQTNLANKQSQHQELNDLYNSFETSQRMFINQKHQSFINNYFQNFIINKNKNNFQSLDNQQFSDKLQKLLDKVLENNVNNYQVNIKTLHQILNQYFQYSLSEYFIFTKKYKKAAEILTDLYESSQNMTSNLPFRIVFKLKQIFDLYNIQDYILQEEYSRFNKNLSFQVAICFEYEIKQDYSYDKNNTCQNSNQNSDYNLINKIKDFSNSQLEFLQELSHKVLYKNTDQISLFTVDQDERCIVQNIKFINSKLFLQLYDNIFYQINNQKQRVFKSQNNHYKYDKSQNSDIFSLNDKQFNVSQHLNELKIEQELFSSKNKQQINQKITPFEIGNLFLESNLGECVRVMIMNGEYGWLYKKQHIQSIISHSLISKYQFVCKTTYHYQVNNPKYKKDTINHLQKLKVLLNSIDWMSNSHDMNPMMSFWALFKKCVKKVYLNTEKDFTIKKSWKNLQNTKQRNL
ncbi:hypothetical protein ABPG72_018817 [Tetrahymena utriculariae]